MLLIAVMWYKDNIHDNLCRIYSYKNNYCRFKVFLAISILKRYFQFKLTQNMNNTVEMVTLRCFCICPIQIVSFKLAKKNKLWKFNYHQGYLIIKYNQLFLAINITFNHYHDYVGHQLHIYRINLENKLPETYLPIPDYNTGNWQYSRLYLYR